MPQVLITAPKYTLLKPVRMPSSEIREQFPRLSMPQIRRGVRLNCDLVQFCEGAHVDRKKVDSDDHLYVQLSSPPRGQRDRRWYIWAPHARTIEDQHGDLLDEGVEISEERKNDAVAILKRTSSRSLGESPAKSKQKEKDLGPAIAIPGFKRNRHLLEPICYVQKAPVPFVWGEATKNGSRIPTHSGVTRNVIKGSQYLLLARRALGPLTVTSWYRDPVTNRRIGGASRSQHLQGNAVDWAIAARPFTESDWRKICKLYPNGGLAAGRGFFHLDSRPYYSTWQYPGAPWWASKRY